jgi:hypothetical protein
VYCIIHVEHHADPVRSDLANVASSMWQGLFHASSLLSALSPRVATPLPGCFSKSVACCTVQGDVDLCAVGVLHALPAILTLSSGPDQYHLLDSLLFPGHQSTVSQSRSCLTLGSQLSQYLAPLSDVPLRTLSKSCRSSYRRLMTHHCMRAACSYLVPRRVSALPQDFRI